METAYSIPMPDCPQKETVSPLIQSEPLFPPPPPTSVCCLSSSHHASLSTAWLHLASPLLNLSLFINVLPVLGGTKTGPGILDVVLMACSAKYRSILVIVWSDPLTSTATSLLVFIWSSWRAHNNSSYSQLCSRRGVTGRCSACKNKPFKGCRGLCHHKYILKSLFFFFNWISR